jgi:glucose-1-phosphate cytidylyltransferase
VDTGEHSLTGGRLRRVRHLLDDTFCFTYGDGLADVNIADLIAFHRSHGGLATLTATQPPGRFGAFRMASGESRIKTFHEKPEGDGAWVNGGYFVLEPGVIDYIDGDLTVWEREPLENLAGAGELSAFKHSGFWQPMDTLRDKHMLEELWDGGKAPWKVWD